MDADCIVIPVIPDINNWTKLDSIGWKISKVTSGQHIEFDLNGVKFLNPSGILMLFIICMEASSRSKEKVRLTNINSDLNNYMKRVGFYNYNFVSTNQNNSWWSRLSADSKSVIEITRLASSVDIGELAEKTSKILYSWFPGSALKLYRDKAITVVMEVCGNSIEHSNPDNDFGECYCTLQKYDHHDGPCIFIAVGDLGIGIRQHLFRRYRWICSTEAEYIKEALGGRSGRLDGSGGMGLLSIKDITYNYNGNLIVRSGKGAVLIDNDLRSYEFKHTIPGTQATIILRPREDRLYIA